jgi:predicted dienelactone hydrolase
MKALVQRWLVWISCLLFAAFPLAAQVGWSRIEIPGKDGGAPAITVALYYPSPSPPRDFSVDPFILHAAIKGEPEPMVKGLILLSHGQGGSEFGYSRLAEALATRGYLVAALRHPGSNSMDNSLMNKIPERWFFERPRQVSRVIDALLADPNWKDRIARDGKGPRIGALGHSAGGYTVLALAGGVPDLAQLHRHIREEGKDDPLFSHPGGSERSTVPPPDPAAPLPAAPPLKDDRVRAVVAMAPAGVLFTAESLAKVHIPVAIYAGVKDRWVVPRFHAEWVAKNLPGAELHMVSNAGHFAFLDTYNIPIQTQDGDVAAADPPGFDPPGFDRAAFLKKLGPEIADFFDKTLK